MYDAMTCTDTYITYMYDAMTCTYTYIYSYVVVITNNSTLNGNDAFSHEMCFYKRINRQYVRHLEHLELAIYSSC